MKKLLLLALALSLPLAQVARADNNNDRNRKKHQREAEAAAAAQRAAAVKHPATAVAQHSVRQPARSVQSRALQSRRAISPQQVNRSNNGRSVDRHIGSYRGHAPVNVQRNHVNRQFNRNSYSVARSRVVRGRHDRDWWRRHYAHTRFVLFGGGYYYWDAGYWYPAYGYSPDYDTYAYDGPIYGYNNLAPGQVLENVQLALRDLGYYRGPIDGLIGPQTRTALAAFQRDNGLVETAAVDEPTLVTLGLA